MMTNSWQPLKIKNRYKSVEFLPIRAAKGELSSVLCELKRKESMLGVPTALQLAAVWAFLLLRLPAWQWECKHKKMRTLTDIR